MSKPGNDSLQVDVVNTPPFTARNGASKQFFAAFIKPLSDKFVLLLILLVVSVVAITEGIGLIELIPMQERVPYFLEVERDATGNPTGRVERSTAIASKFTATEANKRYFINRWLQMVMPIDQKLTVKVNLPKAISWTRGNATNQLQDWVDKKEKIAERMERDPTLTRELDSASINFISDTVAIAHVTLIERSHGIANPIPIRKVLTIEHALVPLEKEEQEYENSIGLTITGFVVNDDMEKQ
jgi:type IV secretory pathway component VirB8